MPSQEAETRLWVLNLSHSGSFGKAGGNHGVPEESFQLSKGGWTALPERRAGKTRSALDGATGLGMGGGGSKVRGARTVWEPHCADLVPASARPTPRLSSAGRAAFHGPGSTLTHKDTIHSLGPYISQPLCRPHTTTRMRRLSAQAWPWYRLDLSIMSLWIKKSRISVIYIWIAGIVVLGCYILYLW